MSKVSVVFVMPNGEEQTIETAPGASVLQLAHELGVEIEGACEGNMACSTCHVVIDEAHFQRLPEASEDEEEMLDLALGLSATSRLGCQIIITEELHGLRVKIPKEHRNMMGF